MEEHTPIDLMDYIPQVELERTEPKDRFNPTSSSYDALLDEVMNSFPKMRETYIEAYSDYINSASNNIHLQEQRLHHFPEEVLIVQRAIDFIRHCRNYEPTIPYAVNNTILGLISNAIQREVNEEQDLTTTIVKEALELLDLTSREKTILMIMHNASTQVENTESINGIQ